MRISLPGVEARFLWLSPEASEPNSLGRSQWSSLFFLRKRPFTSWICLAVPASQLQALSSLQGTSRMTAYLARPWPLSWVTSQRQVFENPDSVTSWAPGSGNPEKSKHSFLHTDIIIQGLRKWGEAAWDDGNGLWNSNGIPSLPGSPRMSMGKTLLSLCLPQSVKLGADTGSPGQQGKNFN